MKKILLIEDNENIRENTAEILELANYSVITAEDGKIGVEKAFKTNPDLIICDILMPVLDGYGVLHMIHNHKETQDTPFIFLSAKTERADIRKGMDLGADDYLTKPFVPTELLNAIESRLKRATLLKQEESTSAIIQPEPTSINSNEIINQFIANRNIIRCKKKQLIYSEGNHPPAIYYLLKGKAKSFKTNEDGKELAIDLYSKGDFIGYTALLDGSTYKESVISMTDVEIAVIPRKDFEELINIRWDIAKRFIKLMAKNVAEKEELLLGLAYNSLRKKVAEALIKLQLKYAAEENEGYRIEISRENLATIAGTATESLIRTLGDFRVEKLIEINNGKIHILNEKKLAQMIN